MNIHPDVFTRENTSKSSEGLGLQELHCVAFFPLGSFVTIWPQEVMSIRVPVRDQSDIPTEPFPKINKHSGRSFPRHALVAQVLLEKNLALDSLRESHPMGGGVSVCFRLGLGLTQS